VSLKVAKETETESLQGKRKGKEERKKADILSINCALHQFFKRYNNLSVSISSEESRNYANVANGCVPDLKLDSRRVVEADGLCQKSSYDRIDGHQEQTEKNRGQVRVTPIRLVFVSNTGRTPQGASVNSATNRDHWKDGEIQQPKGQSNVNTPG